MGHRGGGPAQVRNLGILLILLVRLLTHLGGAGFLPEKAYPIGYTDEPLG
jgi:hypothetical protein